MTLPMPPSKNELHCVVMVAGKPKIIRTKKYNKWLVGVEWLGVVQRCADQLSGSYAMRVTVPPGQDVGNCEEALSDGLKRMRVIVDDRHAQEIRLRRDPTRAEPTVLVELWSL